MDGRKKTQAPSKTGSSIVDDLFGPKDGAGSASASAGYFSNVFPAPSAAMGKDASRRAQGAAQGSGSKPSSYGSPESPYFGSTSVHYGGRDFYAAHHSPTNAANPPPPKTTNTKEGDKQDPSAATRGDWWQGSLYY